MLGLNRPFGKVDLNPLELQKHTMEPLGHRIPSHLNLVRYRGLHIYTQRGHYESTRYFYHRDTPVDGSWWMSVPDDEEGAKMFDEGLTPRI